MTPASAKESMWAARAAGWYDVTWYTIESRAKGAATARKTKRATACHPRAKRAREYFGEGEFVVRDYARAFGLPHNRASEQIAALRRYGHCVMIGRRQVTTSKTGFSAYVYRMAPE